jgi:hypothetical protein
VRIFTSDWLNSFTRHIGSQRHIMKNFSLLFVALIVSCLGTEFALRALGFAPRTLHVNEFFVPDSDTTWSVPDTELGWINRAGSSRAIGEDRATMNFWDFGRRAARPDPAIPPGDRIPVLVVGGSDAQSYGVVDEASFPYLLAERYPNLWIENFGTGGYGTVQAVMMAERAYTQFYGSDQKPQLILLTLADSHFARNVSDQSWITSITDAQGRYISPPHYRVSGEQFVFYPFQAIGFLPLEKRSALVTMMHTAWLNSVAHNSAAEGAPVTRHAVERLTEFAAERNVQLAVAVLLDDTRSTDQVLRGQPFPHKDCSSFGRNNPKKYLLAGNGHPNAELHALFARCIGEWLDAEVLPLLAPTDSKPDNSAIDLTR